MAFGGECQLRQAKMSKGMASELRKHIAILERERAGLEEKAPPGAPKSAQCGCRVAPSRSQRLRPRSIPA